MRTIKFRCWDKEGKKMLKHHEINFNWLQTGDFDYFIPMQFTGLLDKNGKEIYESDVLRLRSFPDSEVIFQGGRFIPIYDRNTGDEWEISSLGTLADECEIIGNIYENKELLTL